MNDVERAAAAAKRLFDEHREGERFTGLPADLGPRNLEEAHAIQDCLQRLNEEHGLGPLAGWKVALTTPVMQRLAGIGHPCAGGIHEAFVYRSPAALNAGDYVRIGVEAEIAVRLSADLAGGGHTRDSVAAAVGALAPAIEIVDDRACDYDALDGLALVADNSFNFGVVLGPETTDWRGLDLPAVRGRLVINGEVVGEGRRRSGDGASVRGARLARRRPRGPRARAPGRGPRHDRQHRRHEVAVGGRRDRRRGRRPRGDSSAPRLTARPIRAGTSRAARIPRRTAISRRRRWRT